MKAAAPPLLFLVAGEPSGDQLGGRLMAALKAETGGAVRFAGIGGPRMAEEGLQSLFPFGELAVMGLVEVLPHLPAALRRLRETTAAARRLAPQVVVTIDSPSFGLRVARRLAGQGIPLVHYVAPQIWAWKPWRARQVARYLDHLLALLPFEPPFFERYGLATTFVGHPAIEALAEAPDPAAFRIAQDIAPDAPLVCALPGSRHGEVARLAPLFGEALERLRQLLPGLVAVVPTVPNVAAAVSRQVSSWRLPTRVLVEPRAKYAAFSAARAALAASGTVAVELAVARTPAVIAYRVSALSAFLARRLIKVDYVSLPNLVLGREIFPELLQERATPEGLAAALEELMVEGPPRSRALAGCAEVTERLRGAGEGTPSQQAARVILAMARGEPVRTAAAQRSSIGL